MRNIIKTSKFLSVTLDDNQVLIVTDTSLFDEIMEAAMNNDDIKIVEIIHRPVADETPEMKVSTHLKDICSGKRESQYLLYRDNQIFIPSISLLSVPQDFAVAFLDAEFNNDESLVKTYLNFWTLVSMNPDANVRKDIFWFIRKWDIKISKSGFLICYRNVVSTSRSSSEKEQITKDYIKIKAQKKSPKNYTYSDEGKLIKIDSLDAPDDAKSLKELYDEVTSSSDTPVYTDQYTHTFKIKIGEKVTMPREECSRDNSVSCSAGLHAGAAGWLERNYFGDTGMMVLVNPAMVTSIPTADDYGKLRCCEYLPVGVVDFDETGHIKDIGVDSGFEDDYLLDYAQEINNEDADNYTINFRYGIDRNAILNSINRMIEERNNHDS